MSVQVGAHYLEKAQGGAGILIGGVPGVRAANVVVIGGGISGTHAVRMALVMEAIVTVIDKNLDRLRELDELFGSSLNTIYSTVDAIEQYVIEADLVIGAVLVPGAAAPKLVTRKMIGKMRPGSVVVDIAIDQGGCFETSHATTHADPVYVVDNVTHYCVANMPGAVARTSTIALNNATLPFAVALANKGAKKALADDPHLLNGLNIHDGQVTYKAVAEALKLKYTPAQQALGL
jgi:alanine dehydrogenase